MSPRGSRFGGALTHPLFLGALVVLVLNDHVLKGSGLLPAVITGKLSDAAGLIVAPVTLAWLLGLKTERGFSLACVATAMGFAILQVPWVAAGITQTGIARVWADPTDLCALPFVLVSYLAFVRPRRARLERPVGALALLACVATSPSPSPRYPFPPAGVLSADVVVRHVGEEDIDIEVRRLRSETTVDCDGLLERPEQMLEDDDFGDAQSWTLSRGDAVPLWDRLGNALDRECYAVRLRDPGGRQWFVTWRHGAPAIRDWRIRLEPGETPEPEAIQLAADAQAPPRGPAGVTIRRDE
ncbi:MAG: hypothetical protein AB7S26_34445 [Sandaracinaceae bacterium]